MRRIDRTGPAGSRRWARSHTGAFGATVAAALLGGCGGGGGDGGAQGGAGSTPLSTGRFVDAPVAGLAYACGGSSGVTNASGEFQYPAGASCAFQIGAVSIGTAAAAALITPVTLVANARDETNTAVQNIVRLLLSLDSDADPTNGITIADATRTALANAAALDFASASFATQAAALVQLAIPNRPLVSAATAAGHMRGTLLGFLDGNYNCSYGGTATGNVALTIAAGVISGGNSSFTLQGAALSNGQATIGSTSSGATFSGSFLADGTGSGTWSDGPSSNGTWSCTRS